MASALVRVQRPAALNGYKMKKGYRVRIHLFTLIVLCLSASILLGLNMRQTRILRIVDIDASHMDVVIQFPQWPFGQEYPFRHAKGTFSQEPNGTLDIIKNISFLSKRPDLLKNIIFCVILLTVIGVGLEYAISKKSIKASKRSSGTT